MTALSDEQLQELEGHTRGPWNLHKGNSFKGFDSEQIVTHGGEAGWFIAACLDDHNGPANAALIAVAPDLLAEVKRLKAYYIQLNDHAVEVHDRLTTERDNFEMDWLQATAQRDKLAEALRACMDAMYTEFHIGADEMGGVAKEPYKLATLALESVEADRKPLMHWTCSHCGRTLPDDELTAAIHCHVESCGGIYEHVEVDSDG